MRRLTIFGALVLLLLTASIPAEPAPNRAWLPLFAVHQQLLTPTRTPTAYPASTLTPTVRPSATPTPDPRPPTTTARAATSTPTLTSEPGATEEVPTPTATVPSGAGGVQNPLRSWKLTLPVDREGGTSGTAAEVKQPALADYTSAYMERNGDGSITFRAPVEGATTSGSTYTRSELREMLPDGSDEAAWTPEDGGRMEQTVAVLELPEMSTGTARVIIGQIHGPDDEPLRLYFYEDGSLRFADDRPISGSETLFPLVDAGGRPSQVPLGSPFTYVLELDRTAIRATVQLEGTTYQAVSPLSAFWAGKALYFKAGAYNAVSPSGSGKSNEGTGMSVVQFFDVQAPEHPHDQRGITMGVLIDRTTWDKTKICAPGQGYGLRGAQPQPTRIIVHTTNGNKGTTFADEASYLQRSKIVGAHYLVGTSGQIARLLIPQLHVAWHAGVTKAGWNNAQTIGIECHFTPGDAPTWPSAMLDSLTLLVLELSQVYTIGDLRTSCATHRSVALPAGRKIDPSGFDDMAFGLWVEMLQCRREGLKAA